MDSNKDHVRRVLAVQQLFALQHEDDVVEDEEQADQEDEEETDARGREHVEHADEDTLAETYARLRRRRRSEALGIQLPVQDPSDGRSVEEKARDHVRSSNFGQQLRKLAPHLPTIGRGNSAANDEASRERREFVFDGPDGIYNALCAIPEVNGIDGFRQCTGFSREEFDDFYDEQGGDRGHLFSQPRNHLGEYTEDENKGRRRVRGTLSDRDRVVCWLEMLRKNTTFVAMEAKYGPSRGTFHNDFKWMTMAAADMHFLHDEIKWPDAEERAYHGSFLEKWGHPDFKKIVYIADGTKVTMRNPSKVGKGLPEPHDEVHSAHYSRNKGLGWSHIVYCNVRGKIIKVDTAKGCSSDRAAHCASDVYLQSASLLSEGETGMGDGNYRGPARMGDNITQMCTPFPNNGHLTSQQKNFNSRQRRFRVVVENTIGQIKKWESVGGKAFRHQRDFEVTVFDVCARLTARITRIRDKYPRSSAWVGNQITDWEAKLGIFLWMDPEDSGSYLIHDRAEDLIYDNWEHGDATLLQNRWQEIWDMEGV